MFWSMLWRGMLLVRAIIAGPHSWQIRPYKKSLWLMLPFNRGNKLLLLVLSMYRLVLVHNRGDLKFKSFIIISLFLLLAWQYLRFVFVYVVIPSWNERGFRSVCSSSLRSSRASSGTSSVWWGRMSSWAALLPVWCRATSSPGCRTGVAALSLIRSVKSSFICKQTNKKPYIICLSWCVNNHS